MRTTISIDEHLLAEARERAQQRRQTLGQYIEDALRHEFGRAMVEAPPIPVFSGGRGPRLGVDLTSNRELQEVLDEGVALEQLR